ncbi:DUF58 domain-containing protein [Vulcanisaeta distributa]|uniref:DUF58 domain-containing protein n=1 Tax=Vulcanisaeta distributa TaxID=164451 RepID=UPI000AE5CF10|nr:DUF58 domain-containing protein [Vulcanisaeta distributa]
MFEALRNVVRNAMSGMGGQVKIVRFTDIDKYPTYVVSVREYKIGDNYFDVDLQKTAMNLSRKSMMHKLFTNKDIVVKEYANVKTIDIVLCLDVSGSMRELSNGMPKIEIAKDAVLNTFSSYQKPTIGLPWCSSTSGQTCFGGDCTRLGGIGSK